MRMLPFKTIGINKISSPGFMIVSSFSKDFNLADLFISSTSKGSLKGKSYNIPLFISNNLSHKNRGF